MTHNLKILWTEWDPVKEEEYTVDPLGLQNFAEILADRILPGLTSRTRKPRYYSFLCWCLQLIEENDEKLAISEFDRISHIEKGLMTLEKLLVLSIVAYYNSKRVDVPDDEKPLLGINKAKTYFGQAGRSFKLDYPFLQNQRFLGCFGAYKTSLETLGFMDPATYTTTKFEEGGRELAKAFCNRLGVKRIVIRALTKRKIRIKELERIGNLFRLSSIRRREKQIISARLRQKYSTRTETFKLFENMQGKNEIEMIENVLENNPQGHDRLVEILKTIRVYEYFSSAVSTIFESILLILQEGKKLSDLLLSEMKFELDDKGLFYELMNGNPKRLDLSIQLLSQIADELKRLIECILLDDNEYTRSLSSFIDEVRRASLSSSNKIDALGKILLERHRNLKGPWAWIAEDPMTHELGLNRSSWTVPLVHSYRIQSLKQLANELR